MRFAPAATRPPSRIGSSAGFIRRSPTGCVSASRARKRSEAAAMRSLLLVIVVAVGIGSLTPAAFRADGLSVPNRRGSVKFAAIGDNGTGEPPEYDVARQMD